MPSVLDSLMDVLRGGDTLTKLGSIFDGDAEQASSAVDAAGPALIGGFAERAQADGGAELITAQLDEADPSLLDDVDGFLDGGETEGGTGILDAIFGEDRDGVLDGLAEQSDLAKDAFAKVLPMLAPLVLSTVAKFRRDDDLDADGVVNLLTSERKSLESDGKLGDWFGKLAGIGGLGALGAAVSGSAGKLTEASDDAAAQAGDAADDAAGEAAEVAAEAGEAAEDAAEAAEDTAEDAAEAAEDTVEDVAEAAEDTAGEAAEAADDAAEDAAAAADAVDDDVEAATDTAEIPATVVDDAKDEVVAAASSTEETATAVAGDAAGAAKTGAAAATTKLADIGDGRGGDDDRRGGLGWLWWALGAVLLVLVLAWLLNQCGDDDATTAGSDGTTETTAETPTTSSAEPSTTEADEATTTAAETTEAETTAGDAGADLQPLVDGALADAGISGVTAEVDGDAVVLTGTVDSDEASQAAQAAVEGLEGVGSVDNQLVVGGAEDGADDESAAGDGSDGDDDASADGESAAEGGDGAEDSADDGEGDGAGSDDAAGAGAGGATLNDELGLEPITFAYRSAAVAPAGQAVLDEIVAYLEENADVSVEIQGHTDSDGTDEENIALSTRRAESVQAYLEAAGIDAGRMEAVGYGESTPKVPNDSADNKAINRRIEFVVTS